LQITGDGVKGKIAQQFIATANGKVTGDDTDPRFDRPPVGEVACGATFGRLPRFTTAHGGLFWSRIHDEFPESEHAAPMATPTQDWIDASSGLPLPRQWFISKDKQGLIQLQGDCLFYNWRRIEENSAYPSYKSVVASYKKYSAVFRDFLRDLNFPTPVVTGCELTYVNHIPQEHGWESIDDLSNVFRDLTWRKDSGRFLPTPRDLSWGMHFSLPTAGTLRVSLSPGTRVRDQMPTLKFELSAKVALQAKSFDDIWEWLDLAHQWIIRGFVDLTQEEIQYKVWKRTK
jgi:uncharacterized protein (TIGR04255 family)